MIRCGELCKPCGNTCQKDYRYGRGTFIACPICDETGKVNGNPCDHCTDGFFKVDRCPRDWMGGEFIEAVNLASMCGKGDWPVAGGLMDQSSWFIDLKQRLESEQNEIEIERSKKD